MRLYESDEDEAKRGSIPSIEVYVEQLEARLASAQAEIAQLGVMLQGAQAEILSMETVIDAAYRMGMEGDSSTAYEEFFRLYNAHLERYPPKGVT